MKTIRIFISSPGDVAEERDRARQVVEQLRHRYAGHFDLKAVLWEDLPLDANISFQQGIDLVLGKETGIDIAVFILWSRLGSPLGPLIRKADGASYRSGTEREFDLVMEARRQGGTDVPKVLVYTRRDEASFDERMRGLTTPEKGALIEQKRQVESFLQEEFTDAATHTNIRAFHSFDHPVTFSQRLRVHLQELLDPLAGDSAGEPVWEIKTKGSPFRGLEPFEFEHSAIFFGREDEVLEVRRALQKKAQDGCAFVLISGASGSGKSSLARAGVLPAIVENEIDSTVVGWRHAAFTPSQLGENLCAGLARLLCGDNVLPELRIAGDSVGVLGEGFAQAPKPTVDQSIRPALARAAHSKSPASRLILLVDQLEELFTEKRLTDAAREKFLAALEALARSGGVWVVATVRSDFYQHCQRLPSLIRMKEGGGQIDLLPPAPDALRRLIEYPARLAGLSFKQPGGASLADRIFNDATAHPELLPLISYVLRELFEQRKPDGVLPSSVYEQLGGVEGALARRAEAVFLSLPDAAQSELNIILRALVGVSGDEEESVVRQHARLESFPPETPARTLVDRFVSERFLITEKSAGGEGTVAVAHEALLRVWNRAAQWIAGNRDFLRIRARVAARMKEGSQLLEGDPLLNSAKHHLATTRAGFTPDQVKFIEASVSGVEAGRRRRERIRRYAIGTLSVLTLAALVAGIVALGERNAAFKQRQDAVQERKAAVSEASRADQSAARAAEALSHADFLQAITLLGQGQLDVLPYFIRSLTINPRNSSALNRLAMFLMANSWEVPTLVLKLDGAATSAQFSRDGNRLLTTCEDGTTRVWDAHTGAPLTEPMKHNKMVTWAEFSPGDNKRILTVSEDKTARVWDALTGQPVTPPMVHSNEVLGGQFSPNGKEVLTTSGTSANIWNAETGRFIGTLTNATPLRMAGYSPDGTIIVTAAGTNLLIWNAPDRKLIKRLDFTYMVDDVDFSPDGERIATTTGTEVRVFATRTGDFLLTLPGGRDSVREAQFTPDGKRIVALSGMVIKVWDAKTATFTGDLSHGSPVITFDITSDGKRLVAVAQDKVTRVWDLQTGRLVTTAVKQEYSANTAQFSHDGSRVVTASMDGSVICWDQMSRETLPQSLPMPVVDAEFSADGKKIAGACKDTCVRIWDAQTDQELTPPLRHSGNVWHAEFSPDGKRILTADDSAVCLWNAQTGKPLSDFLTNTGVLNTAQFSRDGTKVLTASDIGVIQLWDGQTGQARIAPIDQKTSIRSAQLSPDGKWIATAPEDQWRDSARMWNTTTGQEWTPPWLKKDTVIFVEFSTDGNQIVTASGDKTARVWDVRTGKPLYKPLKHTDTVLSAHFASNGRIFTLSSDGFVRLWDEYTGELAMQPVKAGSSFPFASISPDGRRLLTYSSELTPTVWEADSGQMLFTAPTQEFIEYAHLSSQGNRVMALTLSGSSTIKDIPPASSRLPDWMLPLTEALGGYSLNQNGTLEPTKLDRIATLKQIRDQLSRETDADDWTIWGRWFLSDSATRTISPYSKITVPEYIEDQIKIDTTASLDTAQLLAYGNTNVMAKIDKAREALDYKLNGVDGF